MTPIWAVVVDDMPYIRNGYGARSKWYRRVQRTGRAAFIDGPHRYPVTIENVDDEAINRKVDGTPVRCYAPAGAEGLSRAHWPGRRRPESHRRVRDAR